MADEWYYAHDEIRMGPFSGQQLKDLAILGTIVQSDTIWKGGVEKGVLASKVRYLFALPPAIAIVPLVDVITLAPLPAVAPPPEMGATVVMANPAIISQENAPARPKQPTALPERVRKGRIVSIKGADIISQDGTMARYRKKCTVCGHKDSACQSFIISSVTVNAGYYCPKCRKKRVVTIQSTCW